MMAERWSEVQMAYMRADQKQIQRPLSMSTEYVLSGIFYAWHKSCAEIHGDL